MPDWSRRAFLAGPSLALTPRALAAEPDSLKITRARLRAGWNDPPRSCKPHTRWWWPGSAVTPELLTRDLEAMRAAGLGGLEITVVWRFYEKGNLDYLSPAWFDAVRHVLRECQRLQLAAALTFAPGWDFGGPWVPPADRSKVLVPCSQDFQGPFSYEGPLPLFKDAGTPNTGLFAYLTGVEGSPPDHNQTVAVVGARLDGDRLDPDSLVDLTPDFQGDAGRWRMETGRYRLTAFRLRYTGQQNASQDLDNPRSFVVDHLNREAMERYLAPITQRFAKEFKPWLGSTVESIFSDSFEVVPLANSLLWSNSTLAEFKRRKGYDLTPFLPALWWDIGEKTPRVRYDVNDVLHQLALESCYDPFLAACHRLGVKGRMQPHYRFNAEIIAGAGRAHQADTEVTTARYETVADPRKAAASGARFAGSQIVSAEAYTFLHRERYRSTLEEMKIASDAFLRDGATQFWNHGWLFTPEPEVAPTRDFFACERIQPWMPWWPHYRHLAAYIARASYLLRQGRFVADVLLYSPQAQVWSEKALFGVEQRVMRYGDLPRTLLNHGYDYDLVNDDLLQNKMQYRDGAAQLLGHSYRVIILPSIRVMPVATLQSLLYFTQQGGLVIVLDHLPSTGTGLEPNEEWSFRIAAPKFARIDYGFKPNSFSPQEQPFEPLPPLREGQRTLLRLIGERVPPQVVAPESVTFHQRRVDGLDLFFLTNLRPERFAGKVRFRTPAGRHAELWDGVTGAIRAGGTAPMLDIELEPWESVFAVFSGQRLPSPKLQRPAARKFTIEGPWRLSLEGVRFPKLDLEWGALRPWNDDPRTRHFSGTGAYTAGFEAPRSDLLLDLGRVGCTAEAFLNGHPLGVRWMSPYRFHIPRNLVAKGVNQLEVRVMNTLLAHVQGLDKPPDLPDSLKQHYGGPLPATARQTAGWDRDRAFKPLPLSGLAGPVTLEVLAS